MTEKELENLFKKEEVIAYLEKNLKLDLNVEACENIYGYDITADVYLNGKHLASKESGI